MCSKWNIISVPALCNFAALRLIAPDSDDISYALRKFAALFDFGGRWWGTGGGRGNIHNIGASERFHSDLPIPVLALQYPKPIALDGLVFDGDGIVSGGPYAIVATTGMKGKRSGSTCAPDKGWDSSSI